MAHAPHGADPAGRHKLQEPELKDNRFGGPLIPWSDYWSKKLFFLANYEGRRFPLTTQILRIVPTDSLRQGVLRFRGVFFEAIPDVGIIRLRGRRDCWRVVNKLMPQ